MKRFGRTWMVGTAPLKAMLAMLFLLMTSIQPGYFASANATGFHGQVAVAAESAGHVHGGDAHAHDHHDEASKAHSSSDSHHHGGAEDTSDKTCEVHCAPGQAVPVEFVIFDHALDRCFGESRVTVLPRGEYAELIRPPRHLS